MKPKATVISEKGFSKGLRLVGPLCATVAALCMATQLHAAVIVTHSGTNNPFSNGWQRDLQGATVGPSEDGLAWQIADPAGGGVPTYAFPLATAEQKAQAKIGWRLSITVQLVSLVSSNNPKLSAYAAFSLENGTRFLFSIDNQGADGNTRVGIWNNAASMTDTGTKGYVTVHMIYNGTSASLYLGDSPTPFAINYLGQSAGTWSGNAVRFGTASAAASSTTNWQMVQFETIPESNTAFMLLSGLGVLGIGPLRRYGQKRR